MPEAYRKALTLLASAALTLGTALAAPATDERETPSADAIFVGLLAGRDMAPSVAEYLASAELEEKRLDPDRFRPDPLPQRYAQALSVATRDAARVARSARPWMLGDSLDELLTDLYQLQGQQMLLEARARDAYDRVLKINTSAEIVARARAALDHLARESGALATQVTATENLRQLAVSKKEHEREWRDQIRRLHRELQNQQAREATAQAPILRASELPFQRPLFSPGPLPTGAGITPSYLQEAPQAGGGLDLANSPDAPLSDVILAKAAEFENDYVRIYEFVRTGIRTEFYSGAMKGAEATLRSGAGNDIDQASLLLALFRASNVPSRYVHGVVEIPIAQVGGPLGLEDPQQVLTALSRAGIAHQPVIQGGQIAAVRMVHTWVSIYVPYANYRGIAVDLAGKLWLPLAPAIKSHRFEPGSNIAEAAGLTGDGFVRDYLADTLPAGPLSGLRDQVEAYLAANPQLGTLEEQLPRVEISEAGRKLLPSSLPFEVILVSAESPALDPGRQQLLGLRIVDGADNLVMDEAVPLSKLVDRRVTLSYAPATVDDFNVIREFGGMSTVPPYLVRLRPQLKVDGIAITSARGDLPMGASHLLKISVSGPAGSQGAEAALVAGSYAAINLDAQLGLPEAQQDSEVLADDTEGRAARLLSNHLARYAADWDQAEEELAGWFDLAVVRPLPALTLISTALETTQTQGLLTNLSFTGVNLDAALRSAEPISRQADADAENRWMRLAALQGSYLESFIFEQQWAVESISADKGLRLANEQSIAVNEVNPANAGTVIPGLSHPQAVIDSVQGLVDSGYSVLIPDTEITLNAWTGSVWHVWDPDSGGSGYFISGALAGGSTSEDPADWVLDDLANALGNPYGGEPNDDPLSAASIRRLPATDGQIGKAGEELERDLLVLVTDRDGRPVQGAEVNFSVILGDAQLDDGSGDPVLTNSAGIAAASVQLGTRTDISPIYVRLESGDEFTTQITENWITAAVVFPDAQLPLAFPFIVYTGPADASALEAVSGNPFGFPGAWVGPVQFRLADEFSNPISNQDMTFTAGSPIVQCGFASAQPARLFASGECVVPFVPGTSSCGDSTITVRSNSIGRYVQIINGSGPMHTRYPIRVTADGVDPFDFESLAPRASRLPGNRIITQETLSLGYFGNVIDSAALAEITPFPRKLSVYVAREDPVDGCIFTFSAATGGVSYLVEDGGGPGSVEDLGDGNYEVLLPVADVPTNHTVRIGVTGVSVGGGEPVDVERSGWPVAAVEPKVESVAPEPVPLNDNGVSMTPIIVNYDVQPPEFPVTLQVNLLEDANVIDFKFVRRAPNIGQVAFAAGRQMDLERTYEVEVLVNPRTQFEIASERFEVRLTAPIVKAVRNQSGRGGGRVINGRVLQGLQFFNDIDIPNERLCRKSGVTLELTQAATLSMEFERLDVSGDPNGQVVTILNNESFTAGLHPVDVSADDLGTDGFVWRITATSQEDGHIDQVAGSAGSSFIQRNSLPIGHPIVKGVDLSTGKMVLSRQDINVPGLGANLQFIRSYATGARSVAGPIGSGWSHNYMSRVERTMCGDYVVSGAEGGTVRFVREGSSFRTLKGYHGTLRENAEDTFDFFPKSGIRFHYVKRQDPTVWWLDHIEDTNGNRTQFAYEDKPDTSLLTAVTDASGRQLTLTYEKRSFRFSSSDVVTSVQGPGGITLTLDYDVFGNLISAEREGGSASETYEYMTDSHIGNANLLLEATDNVVNANRQYEYAEIMLVSTIGSTTLDILSSTVTAISEPDGGRTSFTYTVGPAGPNAQAVVRDGNGNSTTYTMNEFGAGTTTAAPNGTKSMEWETDTDVLLLSETDENGRITSFEYDANGNVTSEQVGSLSRSSSYAEIGMIKNRVASSTNFRGQTTTNSYDGAGNLISETLDGVTTVYTYDSNGNRRSITDGNGNTTTSTYDQYGYETNRTNAEGGTSRFSYDVRGRRLSEQDPNGNTTTFTYDNRDRITRTQFPDGATVRFDYGSRTRTETDARGGTTTTTMDPMGRIVSTRNAMGSTETSSYDLNGNKTSASDFAGRTTTFSYDGANRLISRSEPEARVTTFAYDGVGNILSETVSGSGGSRTTTFGYDPDRYFQTSMNLGGLALTTRSYDGEGNVTTEVDPAGRTTTFTYDAFNRMTSSNGPLGSGQDFSYDAVGNLLTETTRNTGEDQLRRFVYDGANRRIQSIDAEGAVRSMDYDATGNVVKEVDGRGKATDFVYDQRHRRVRITDPVGGTTQFEYDLNGNLVQQTQANGNVLVYAYDALNRRTSETDSVGAILSRTFDAVGNVLTETDALGNTTTNTYDGLDRLISMARPAGRGVAFGYNVFGDLVTETDAAGNAITHDYDGLGRRISTTGPAGLSLSFGYDSVGNLTSSTDSRGNVTTNAYNDLNQRVSIDDPLYSQSFSYDLIGNLLSESDRRGILSTFKYDRENRNVEFRRAGIVIERRTYDANGNLLFLVDANGNSSGFEYDDRNLVSRENRPELSITTFTRNIAGDVISENRPAGRTIQKAYDARHRQISETNPAGEQRRFEFDLNNNRTAIVEPQGTWQYEYDAANRLAAVVNPLGDHTRYEYDTRDNRTAQTDASNRRTQFSYDDRNRLTQKSYPDGATIGFEYDANNNVVRRTDPNGTIASFVYDALDRRTNQQFSGSFNTISVVLDYDPNSNVVSVSETNSVGAGGVITQSFDNFDRLTSYRDRFGQQLQYAYDANGNRTQLLDNSGQTTLYSYDALNRLTSIGIPGLGTASYDYLPNSLIKSLDYPNGALAEYQYDLADRVTEIVNSQAGEDVAVYRYQYDASGNRVRQEEENGNGLEVSTYGYDAAGRLMQVSYPDRDVSYVLDATGNRLTETIVSAAETINRSFSYNERDHLLSVSDSNGTLDITYAYDANGNQTAKTVNGLPTIYAFDARNRVAAVTIDGASGINYEYDYKGLRVAKEVAGSRMQYIYDERSVLAETNTLGNTVARYHYTSDRRLAEARGGQNNYFLQDALRTTVAITDQAGALISRYTYDAWGNRTRETGSSEQPFGFTGYEFDDETGLYYAQQRYYDAFTGRFLSEDPFKGDVLTPPSLHRYLYALSNPTVFIDPTGELPIFRDFLDRFTESSEILRSAADDLNSVEGNIFKRGAAKLGAGLLGALNVTVTVTGGAGELVNAAANGLVQSAEVVTQQFGGDFGELGKAVAEENQKLSDGAIQIAGVIYEDPLGVGAKLITGAVSTLGDAVTGDTKAIFDVTTFAGDLLLGRKGLGSARSGLSRGSQIASRLDDEVAALARIRANQATPRAQALNQRINARVANQTTPPASAPTGPVRTLDAGEFGPLTRRGVVGDRLTPDHQPSAAATRRAAERTLDRKLTPTEARNLRDRGACLVIPECVHRGASRTYGGRNNATKIDDDSRDLLTAARKDRDALRQRFVEDGFSETEIDEAFKVIDELNQKPIIFESNDGPIEIKVTPDDL